ncbi:T9SS type A sorting domain-containing protein [Pontibacter sp. FD36]|uniref:lectin-like domain-containing protein n=1 Tax=Pontibacter sp. FD36 TaxID=2789860 RepID=UPI0018A903FD|nr:T9SS type A sorting domain-containing protein [Pontibacter sp. FD36]MBF8962791.1 T9SS type A sorting domain-containing protein [Pontibacter sp. FD36]
MPTIVSAPSRHGTGTVELRVSGAPAGGRYQWYTGATGNNAISGAIGATFTTPEISTTTSYYVTAVNAQGCESGRREVVATVTPDNPATYSYLSASYARLALKSGTVVATATDPDGAITDAVISGTALPSFLTLNPTTGAITVNNNTVVSGTYTRNIILTDARGGRSTVSVTITINDDLYQASGTATKTAENCYRLTTATGNQQGQVWSVNTISLNNSFEITFNAYFGDNNAGADGIAFGFQRTTTNPAFASGAIGQGLGFQGITPSFGVEFDTYQNGTEPSFDHTNFFWNGIVTNSSSATATSTAPVQMSSANVNVEDGNTHAIRIVWNRDTNTMSVYFNNVLRTSYTNDIVASIFGGNANVHFGYTASTGGSVNVHSVCEIRYNQTPIVNANSTTSAISNEVSTAVVINPISATDADGSIASFRINTLPTSGTLFINGTAVTSSNLNTTYTATNGILNSLTFRPVTGYSGTSTFTFSAIDNEGLASASPATYSIPVTHPPKAENIEYELDDPKIQVISKLEGNDSDGTVASFTILSLPESSHGRLFLDNVAVTVGQTITIAQSEALSFEIAKTFKAPATFTYTATDNLGVRATNSATYSLLLSAINPLPVELTSFKATAQNNQVVLNWTTASETDNDRFEVERSNDGRTFTKIGIVKGKGTSSLTNFYTFKDANPGTGTNYYRLRQVDFDGKFEYSKTVAANIKANAASVKAYPNPSQEYVRVELATEEIGQAQVMIMDVQGRVILERKIIIEGRFTELELPTQDLATGVYFLKIKGANMDTTTKLVKQR